MDMFSTPFGKYQDACLLNHGKSMFSVVRNHHTDFQSGCATLHSISNEFLLFHILLSNWAASTADSGHSNMDKVILLFFLIVLWLVFEIYTFNLLNIYFDGSLL